MRTRKSLLIVDVKLHLTPPIHGLAVVFRALLVLAFLARWTTAQDLSKPIIDAISPFIHLEGGEMSATVWVTGVTASADIQSVQGTIVQPTGAPLSVLDQFFLGQLDAGVYEATYDGFFLPGEYTILVEAVDMENRRSDPATMTVTQLAQTIQDDRFEPDNSAEEAKWFGLNVGLHAHTFSSEGDEDWVLFYAQNFREKSHLNETDIETRNLDPGVDTKMELYKLDPADPEHTLQFIVQNDDRAEGDPSSFIEIFLHDHGAGFYALRVLNQSGLHGPHSRYDVRVWRDPVLACALAGVVYDADSSNPIAGAHVGLTNFGQIEAIADSGGRFVFPGLPANETFTLMAWSDDHDRSTPVTVLGEPSRLTTVDFYLVQAATLEEIAQTLLEQFNTTDTDADGNLSLAEAQATVAGLTESQFMDLDADGGGIARLELEAIVGGEGEGEGEPGKGPGCHASDEHPERPTGDVALLILLASTVFLVAIRPS